MFEKLKKFGNEQANNKSVAIIFAIAIAAGLLGVLILIYESKSNLGSAAYWVSGLVSPFAILLLVYLVKKLPGYIADSMIEKEKGKNNRQLQVESYFRQIGGTSQEDLFNKWTKFLTDMTKNAKKYSSTDEGIERYRQLIHDSIIYASDRTLEYIAAYSQFTFKQKKQVGISDETGLKMLVYVAYIISNLKEDFSGYKVDPKRLIQMELTDYNENIRDKIEKIENELLEEIN